MSDDITRVPPTEALRLVSEDGYTLVDVRSVPEFEAGHPAGAVNIPWAHPGAFGMAPNADFLKVVGAHFAKDAKLVVACRSGGRSLQAAKALTAAGFSAVVDQKAGFSGGSGEIGWEAAGLPVDYDAAPERQYAALSKAAE